MLKITVRSKPKQSVRFAKKVAVNLILIISLLSINFSLAQLVYQGVAPVQSPTGGFAVDGDAFADTLINGEGDWFLGLILPHDEALLH